MQFQVTPGGAVDAHKDRLVQGSLGYSRPSLNALDNHLYVTRHIRFILGVRSEAWSILRSADRCDLWPRVNADLFSTKQITRYALPR